MTLAEGILVNHYRFEICQNNIFCIQIFKNYYDSGIDVTYVFDKGKFILRIVNKKTR